MDHGGRKKKKNPATGTGTKIEFPNFTATKLEEASVGGLHTV